MKSILTLILLIATTAYGVRLKDLTIPEGSRDNQLVGYGIVIGLSGTGDSKVSYTTQSVANYLKRFGLQIPADKVAAGNIAAVMVTSNIGPYAKEGSRLDVTVSSIGDAASLQGGVLLQTPLIGADSEVYAVAQGPVAVGGFVGGSNGNSIQQNHPTVAMMTSGAIVEREISTEILKDGAMNLVLMNPDSTSAARLADKLNSIYPGSSYAASPSYVNVRLPKEYIDYPVNFLAAIGDIEITPDAPAKVIINERTGTIVATSTVKLLPVAISHGSLTITVSQNMSASQPNAFGEGETLPIINTSTEVEEVVGGFEVLPDAPTLDRLTGALNALGVSTRDMMSILQALKKAGALQAELITD